MEETNLTCLETNERGVVIEEIKKETFLDEPTREHVPGIDMNMAIDVKGSSFDQMNRAMDGIADCINSSIEDITQNQAKVNEHSNNIDEGNLSKFQITKKSCQKIFVASEVGL